MVVRDYERKKWLNEEEINLYNTLSNDYEQDSEIERDFRLIYDINRCPEFYNNKEEFTSMGLEKFIEFKEIYKKSKLIEAG